MSNKGPFKWQFSIASPILWKFWSAVMQIVIICSLNISIYVSQHTQKLSAADNKAINYSKMNISLRVTRLQQNWQQWYILCTGITSFSDRISLTLKRNGYMIAGQRYTDKSILLSFINVSKHQSWNNHDMIKLIIKIRIGWTWKRDFCEWSQEKNFTHVLTKEYKGYGLRSDCFYSNLAISVVRNGLKLCISFKVAPLELGLYYEDHSIYEFTMGPGLVKNVNVEFMLINKNVHILLLIGC